jgi:hypothetical protein
MQPHPCALLQIAYHAEQILRLRIAARAEHADQALGRRAGGSPELFKSDRRLDVIPKDDLAGLEVAAEQRIDALAQQGLGESIQRCGNGTA